MANIFWTKRDIHNWTRALESTRGLLHRLKISWTSTKRVKIEPEFSPTLRKLYVLLCCQALHVANGTQPNFVKWEEVNGADASRIGWRRIVNVNETIKTRSLVSRGPKNHFRLAMASRRASFSGNTPSVATFSSYIYHYAKKAELLSTPLILHWKCIGVVYLLVHSSSWSDLWIWYPFCRLCV